MKKTVVMDINQTIERIKRTANLKVIGIKRPIKKKAPQSPSAALNNNLNDGASILRLFLLVCDILKLLFL